MPEIEALKNIYGYIKQLEIPDTSTVSLETIALIKYEQKSLCDNKKRRQCSCGCKCPIPPNRSIDFMWAGKNNSYYMKARCYISSLIPYVTAVWIFFSKETFNHPDRICRKRNGINWMLQFIETANCLSISDRLHVFSRYVLITSLYAFD